MEVKELRYNQTKLQTQDEENDDAEQQQKEQQQCNTFHIKQCMFKFKRRARNTKEEKGIGTTFVMDRMLSTFVSQKFPKMHNELVRGIHGYSRDTNFLVAFLMSTSMSAFTSFKITLVHSWIISTKNRLRYFLAS